jgi:hypothetical protein
MCSGSLKNRCEDCFSKGLQRLDFTPLKSGVDEDELEIIWSWMNYEDDEENIG